MRKLSFIMAVLMILMCMPIMSAASVSAVEEASVTEYSGKGVAINLPDGWTTVSEANAIGFVWNNESKVYVDTLTNAANIARANSDKQIVFYLTDNYTTSKRIGIKGTDSNAYEEMNLSNANLVVDGQGKYSIISTYVTSNQNYDFIYFGSGNGTGELTFRNLTINSTGSNSTYGARFTTVANSLKKLTLKNIKVLATKFHSSCLDFKTDTLIDGITINCGGNSFVGFGKAGVTLTVNDATVTNAGAAFDYVSGDVVVNGGTYTCNNMLAKLWSSGNTTFTINGGTFTGCSNSSNAVFRVETGNNTINIHGGTFNIDYAFVRMNNGTKCSNNTVNITGGEFTVRTVNNLYGFFIDKTSGTDVSTGNTYNISGGKFEMNCNNGRFFVFNAGQNITLNIDGGDFVAAKNVFSIMKSPNLQINVNGGTFTSLGEKDEVLWQNTGDISKVVNINGGTFNSCQKTIDTTDTTISGSGYSVYGIMYSTSNCPVYINGGTFNLYSGAVGGAYSDNGVHILTTGSGNFVIRGGVFNGGKYVNITGSKKFSEASKIPMPTLEEGQTNTCYDISIKTTAGASIRTNTDTSGIRFQGSIGKHAIDYMTTYFANGKNVYCGVAIVPEDYLTATNGVFTYEALTAAGLEWATTNASNGKITKADGSSTINIALTGIKEGNYNRNFVAIAYVYADNDGNQKVSDGDTVFYAGKTSDARSVSETAKAALADVKNTSTGDYCTEITSGYYYVKNSDGTYAQTEITNAVYSRFTLTQLEALKKYA